MIIKRNKLYNMDCREGLQLLDDDSIDCVVTSPPYWSLRDYNIEPSIWDGDPNCKHEWVKRKIYRDNPIRTAGGGGFKPTTVEQTKKERWRDDVFCQKCVSWLGCLGLEPDFNLYIKHLCDVFNVIKQKLKKRGTCWVNIGDTYAFNIKGSGGLKSEKLKIKNKENFQAFKSKKVNCNVPNKCLLMIPQRFAIEMIDRGWILRNVIIWHKPNGMPSSAKDRFTVDFEYIYFFVKSRKYYFEQQFDKYISKENHKLRNKNQEKYKGTDLFSEGGSDYYSQGGRNKRCVWKIPAKPNSEAHFAVFPPKLVKTPIKAGCPLYICKKCGKAKEKLLIHEGYIKAGHGGGLKKTQDTFDMLKLSKSSALRTNKKKKYIKKGYTNCDCNAGFKAGIVLDPFAGIGTTLLQAYKLGRDFIGFELSEEYCKIANKYLKKETNFKRLDQF